MAEVATPIQSGEAGSDGSTAEQAQEKAREVAGQAKEQAQEAAGQAKGRVREQVDQRSTEAGEQVSSTAGDLRTVGEELRKQGKDTPAKFADQAAERAERAGRYLTESDADRILSDVEDFARRQPWAVAVGGLALGFAASRFLKASSSQRYQASQSGGSDSPSPSTSPAMRGDGASMPPTPPAYAPATGDAGSPATQGLTGSPPPVGPGA